MSKTKTLNYFEGYAPGIYRFKHADYPGKDCGAFVQSYGVKRVRNERNDLKFEGDHIKALVILGPESFKMEHDDFLKMMEDKCYNIQHFDRKKSTRSKVSSQKAGFQVLRHQPSQEWRKNLINGPYETTPKIVMKYEQIRQRQTVN